MKGIITDIKRLAIHDGPGIRTTVFFKGCPLKCKWCHNPESISFDKQLAFFEKKCINCRKCENICNFHKFDGKHTIDFENCYACGNCAKICPTQALKLYGREVTVQELMPLLLEDRIFFEESDGGVTLSGGECLAQPIFAKELLIALKKENINTAVDTCGFVKTEVLDEILPYTDIFLYDIKAIDEQVHIDCTGVSNELIKSNLDYLGERGSKIEIRIPLVPFYNDGEMAKIGEFLTSVKGILGVRILPYHNFCDSRYHALNLNNTMPQTVPTDENISKAKEILKSYNLNVF